MELRDYLRVLRAHWIAVVVFTVLGTGVAFAWTAMQPRVYTATTSGYVTIDSTAADGSNGALANSQLALAQVASLADVGTWRSVASYAIDSLSLKATPDALLKQVTVTNPLNTVILQVSANAATPGGARDLAEAWIQGMQKQIAKLQGNTTAKGATVALTPGDSAQLPTSPSSPKVGLSLALGALIGLALGIAYAVLRHVLDRKVRDPLEIQRQTGATVVGTIPLEKQLSEERRLFSFDGSAGSQSFAAAVEAIRELRTNLQYMSVDDPPRVIVVTSPLPGDGKSVTAANLARGLSAAGETVILIDADLRRPMVSSIFDLPDGAGLTDLLAGRATVQDIAYTADRSGHLAVLPAGRIPPNPSEVLSSQRMASLVRDLGKEAYVIIDSPPAIPVTDSAILSTIADGVLMVVSSGNTTYDALQKALENIARAKGHVLGVVLNKAPRRGAGAYSYGYKYEGYFTEDEEPAQSGAGPRGHAPGPRRRRGASTTFDDLAGLK